MNNFFELYLWKFLNFWGVKIFIKIRLEELFRFLVKLIIILFKLNFDIVVCFKKFLWLIFFGIVLRIFKVIFFIIYFFKDIWLNLLFSLDFVFWIIGRLEFNWGIIFVIIIWFVILYFFKLNCNFFLWVNDSEEII